MREWVRRTARCGGVVAALLWAAASRPRRKLGRGERKLFVAGLLGAGAGAGRCLAGRGRPAPTSCRGHARRGKPVSAGTAEATARGEFFARALYKHGFNFFTGVPCSLIGSVIAALVPAGWIAETREDAALGLAAGAALAGRVPVVLMQNSGLGVSINALGSLHAIYRLPVLLVVTWRGEGRGDAPEHLVMGRAMAAILDAIEVPWRRLGADTLEADVAWARAVCDAESRPVALVVPAGLFA